MKALNILLEEGIYISGTDCAFLMLLAALIAVWVITDLIDSRARKKAYEASLIHYGWLNHEQWVSDQISNYRQFSGDWNGVPIEMIKSERGEYLWTIPFTVHPGKDD